MAQVLKPEHTEGYERRWWILGVLCLSLLVIGLDNTILNVALPTLSRDLGATNSQLQWMVDAYVLVFAGLLLTTGSLSDRYGRRKALALGLIIFGVGSTLSAFSGTSNALITSRALMGVGGALIMPSTLSILTNVFPADERGRAIGIWAGVSGLGIAIGPIVGGWLLNHFWWGSVFLVNVPVVIVALILGRLIVPDSKDPSPNALDPVGAVLSIVGLVSLVYAIIEAPDHGWTSTQTLVTFAFALIVLAAFAIWELRSDHPMLDVTFFENPRFTAANISIVLVFFALFGSLFFLTQYLQFVLGYTPLQAGLRVAPIALVLMVSAPLAGRFVARFGNKVLVAAGMTAVAIGLGFLGTITVSSGYPHVLIALVILGAGMGTAMVPATESIMGSLPLAKAGLGSAMNDTTRQIGGALGVAILGSVFASSFASHVSGALAGLPATAAAEASQSVGAAIQIGQTMGGTAGAALVAASKQAFISAMDKGLFVGATIALVGAMVALIWLPSRAATPTEEPLPEEFAPEREVAVAVEASE
ncbi:MAG TPA: DHA2 family efflux MFS transporter permease subunit [Actinomycetota bacterium]|nr:DHA2 family efflux MFS transporter permease subunit [Actinomycetota bacterium]